MDAKELRDKTPDQLRDQLSDLKKEAFNLRFQQASGQLENTARMRAVRRDAARVKTIRCPNSGNFSNQFRSSRSATTSPTMINAGGLSFASAIRSAKFATVPISVS